MFSHSQLKILHKYKEDCNEKEKSDPSLSNENHFSNSPYGTNSYL